MKKKDIIIVSCIVAAVCIGIIVLIAFNPFGKNGSNKGNAGKENNSVTEANGVKKNTSEELGKDRTVDGFKFTNIALTQYEKQTVFEADCTNTTGKDTDKTTFDVTLVDKNGKELAKVVVLVVPLKNGEKTHVYYAAETEMVNSYNFKIKKA